MRCEHRGTGDNANDDRCYHTPIEPRARDVMCGEEKLENTYPDRVAQRIKTEDFGISHIFYYQQGPLGYYFVQYIYSTRIRSLKKSWALVFYFPMFSHFSHRYIIFCVINAYASIGDFLSIFFICLGELGRCCLW